jgi:hypothetical protein
MTELTEDCPCCTEIENELLYTIMSHEHIQNKVDRTEQEFDHASDCQFGSAQTRELVVSNDPDKPFDVRSDEREYESMIVEV